MAIEGSVTSAVSGTSVTLPSKDITLIGATVFAHTTSGYLSIPIDGSRNALFPFVAAIAVVTTLNPETNINGGISGIQPFILKPTGATLNYTGTGLSGGTFVFYYGTAFPGSLPLTAFAAVAVSHTTGTSLAFTFPSGDIVLTGITHVHGSSSSQTLFQFQASFNTGPGKTVLFVFGMNMVRDVIPLNNIVVASTLTVTGAYTGLHVGTGYLIIYYR